MHSHFRIGFADLFSISTKLHARTNTDFRSAFRLIARRLHIPRSERIKYLKEDEPFLRAGRGILTGEFINYELSCRRSRRRRPYLKPNNFSFCGFFENAKELKRSCLEILVLSFEFYLHQASNWILTDRGLCFKSFRNKVKSSFRQTSRLWRLKCFRSKTIPLNVYALFFREILGSFNNK